MLKSLALLILVLLSVAPASALPRIRVADVIGNPTRFKDMRVKVEGQVTKVEPDATSPSSSVYTVQDSSDQVIRVKSLVAPPIDSRVLVVGMVVQDDAQSKPYLVEITHGAPGLPLPLLLGAGGVLVVIALVMIYFIVAPKPVKPQPAKDADPKFKRRPIITQVFRDDPVAMLAAVSGPHKGEIFKIYGGTNTIGRDDNQTVQLTGDTTVSRSHARINAGESGVVLINESTTNPTKIDGEDVLEKELIDGDIIQIGSTRFKVSIISSK